jgi:hypothetical protein
MYSLKPETTTLYASAFMNEEDVYLELQKWKRRASP